MTERIVYVAPCPSCGSDATWTSKSVMASPWPYHGSAILVSAVEVVCDCVQAAA